MVKEVETFHPAETDIGANGSYISVQGDVENPGVDTLKKVAREQARMRMQERSSLKAL